MKIYRNLNIINKLIDKIFPYYKQLDSMDCGPSCLRMIAKYYKRSYSLQELRDRSFITRQGVSMLGISEAAESIHFRTQGVKITLLQLVEDVPLPCILHWNQNHFVVLYNIKKNKTFFSQSCNYNFMIADPARGKYVMNKSDFEKCWISTTINGDGAGTSLILTPSPEFYIEKESNEKKDNNLLFYLTILR